MSLMHIPLSRSFQPTRPPLRVLMHIFLGFSLSLAVLFLIVLFFVGPPGLLAAAATIKPYAVAYQPPRGPSAAGGRVWPKNPIIFLGDSSVAQAPWAPEGLPAIPALLQEALDASHPRPSSTRVLDWSFPGGRLFHYYCLLFEAERYDPALVVIPINWRSIGPVEREWNDLFAYPELSSLVPPQERSFPSVSALMREEGISQSRRALYALHRPMLYVGGMKAFIRSALTPAPVPPQTAVLRKLGPGEHLIERSGDETLFRHYTATPAQHTPSMDALRLIVETAQRRDISVCFYITPIHLNEMRSRPSFDDVAFEASIGRILAQTTSDTTRCLDLSGLLHEDLFLDNYEHYTLEGNRAIALALAPAVRKSLAP